jgi:hypothetical protein
MWVVGWLKSVMVKWKVKRVLRMVMSKMRYLCYECVVLRGKSMCWWHRFYREKDRERKSVEL